MKITLGKGFTPPQGMKPGEQFDAVATLTMGPEGIELVSIDGVDVMGEEEEEKEEEGEGKEMEAEAGEGESPEEMPMADAGKDRGGKLSMPWG